ncbi:MAG: FAD-binding oxidoreductase [Desulfobacterota bacterium]|nr:FAD-binding oxidoreductase [Thermodesulfobacteriota bacterium]
MATTATLQTIVQALSKVVGEQNVSTDKDVLERFSRDTSLMPPRMPDVVVRVMTREDVMGVLKIAHENRIPAVPRSSGTGTYGTGIPEQGGIIIDLSGMKRIPRVDTRNRWALFEAGVTFGELRDELAKHGMQPLNTLLPRKDKSVVTSILEREPVLTCKTECDEPVRTMEIVWGTGELFRTGAMAVDPMPPEEIPDKTYSDLCSVGGPGVDWWRLMTGTQGTFGVITIMNAKIFHKPLLQKVVLIPFDNLDDLVKPLYTIQHREIGHECFVLNNYNLACIFADNDAEIPELARRLPPFCIVLNLWGGQFFPEERLAYEEKAVNEIAEQYQFAIRQGLPGVPDANIRFENMLTSPWEGDVYWKDRYRGACLELVFESGLDEVPAYWKLFTQLAGEAGMDVKMLGIYIQPRQRCRVCHVEFHIPCDAAETEAQMQTKQFHRYAAEAVMNAGAFFYRPYYDWADMIYSRAGYTHEVIKKIKKILDPHHTLNPGRLGL